MPGYYYIVGTDGGAVYPGKFRPNSNGWYVTSMSSNLGATFSRYLPGELPVSTSLAGRAPGRFSPSVYANTNFVYDAWLTNGIPLESSGASQEGERWNEKWVFLRARGITNLAKWRLDHVTNYANIVSGDIWFYQQWRLNSGESFLPEYPYGFRYDRTNHAWLGSEAWAWSVSRGQWVADTNLATGFDVSDIQVRWIADENYVADCGCPPGLPSTNVYTGQPCGSIQWFNGPQGYGPYCVDPTNNPSYWRTTNVAYTMGTNWVSEGNVGFYIGSRRVVAGALAGYKLRFNSWGH